MFKHTLVCIVLMSFSFIIAENSLPQNIVVDNFNISEHENSIKVDETSNLSKYFTSLLMQLPPLNLTISNDISDACRRHSFEYLKKLQNLTFWAVKMYDASAKLPSGILSGNINQLGDFDECINLHSDDGEISGKYCLANIQTEQPIPDFRYLFKLHNLINSHYPIRSDLDDPGHIGPRPSSIKWGLCIPASCSHKDVEIGLTVALQTFLKESGISLKVRVTKELCQVADNPIPWSTILIGMFFVVYFLFVITVTIYDYHFQCQLTDSNDLIYAFSLHRNLKSLFSLERSTDDIKTVHGIRFLNMVLLLITHKVLAAFYIGFVNRNTVLEFAISSWAIVYRCVTLYTDTFLMLSGMLVAYSYFGLKNRRKSFNIIEDIISRLVRILPSLLAVILFVGFIHPWLGSGPQWNAIVVYNSELCQNYGWRNLLSIQNFFGAENLCIPHSHHIGTDTLLFLISPVLLWILWKWKKYGVIVILIVATWSAVLRYSVVYSKNLTLSFYYGASLKQLYGAANSIYILPTHRATSYLIGILLGYYLRTTKNIVLKPIILNIGYATAVALFCYASFGFEFMVDKSYKYNPADSAWYSAFVPIPWCLFWGWIILTDYSNYHNIFTKFLSWPGFLITTRLSYAIYLTQLPILFHNAATNRSSEYFSLLKTVFNFHELGMIILISIMLTVLFEKPFDTIKKSILKKYEKKSAKRIATE